MYFNTYINSTFHVLAMHLHMQHMNFARTFVRPNYASSSVCTFTHVLCSSLYFRLYLSHLCYALHDINIIYYYLIKCPSQETVIHQIKLPRILWDPRDSVTLQLMLSKMIRQIPTKKKHKKVVHKNWMTMKRMMRHLPLLYKNHPPLLPEGLMLVVDKRLFKNHPPLVPEGLILVVDKTEERLCPLKKKATAQPRQNTYLTCSCRRRRNSVVPNGPYWKGITPRPQCTA